MGVHKSSQTRVVLKTFVMDILKVKKHNAVQQRQLQMTVNLWLFNIIFNAVFLKIIVCFTDMHI